MPPHFSLSQLALPTPAGTMRVPLHVSRKGKKKTVCSSMSTGSTNTTTREPTPPLPQPAPPPPPPYAICGPQHGTPHTSVRSSTTCTRTRSPTPPLQPPTPSPPLPHAACGPQTSKTCVCSTAASPAPRALEDATAACALEDATAAPQALFAAAKLLQNVSSLLCSETLTELSSTPQTDRVMAELLNVSF